MSEPRIIKKYPNRRLYDTAVSSYITLGSVKKLVLERTEFNVIDSKTNTDITRGILLQIISEQEEQGNPIFTTEVLAHIIRFYGDTLQGMMGSYLEKSLQAFVDQQHLFKEQIRSIIGNNPLSMVTELVEHNLALWQSVNERLLQNYTTACIVASDPASFIQQAATATTLNIRATAEQQGNSREERKKKQKELKAKS
jgi:polyhydroxyalkanoate synthesis repressor PhaR